MISRHRSAAPVSALLAALFFAAGCMAHKPADTGMTASSKPAPASGDRAASAASPSGSRLSRDEIAASVKAAMDPDANPCEDFYQYACGGWVDTTTIPPDRPRWERGFTEIDERNRAILRETLEAAASNPGSDSDRKKLGDFYASCMNEEAIERAGAAPLKPALDEILKVADLQSFMGVSGSLYRQGVPSIFQVFVDSDQKDPDTNIAQVYQGGMGLPDRDYYLKEDADKVKIRQAYRDHVKALLVLLGDAPAAAAKSAESIMVFETGLAKVAWSQTEMRDADKTYHKIDLAGLQGLTPHLSWGAFLRGAGQPGVTQINVATPSFFEGADAHIAATSPAVLRDWMRARLVNDAAPSLSKAFVDQNFRFTQAITGQKELPVRWKRCVTAADGSLGELLGKSYVDRAFGGDSKKIALALITDVESSFAANLAGLDWMDDETRGRALEKMKMVQNKIGYPDKWRDYSSLEVRRDDWFGNTVRAAAFEWNREAGKVGKPVDKTEWGMTPPTVNAYYNAGGNEMVFPAGIMQPPFFHRDFPAPMNYGGMGLVMGHELTHGFDDEGRKFDGHGVLTDWWNPTVVGSFEKAASCIEKQYSEREVLPGLHVNGELTLGENIADNGGVKQAWGGWKSLEAAGKAPSPLLSGITNDQLFFIGFAQTWCSKRSPEIQRLFAQVDPHSPPELRVNIPLLNFPQFAKTFHCVAGAKMNPANRCEVW